MQTFKKEERLNEKKIIKELFEKGFEFYSSPIKVLWQNVFFESNYPAKVMITVSSRNFRKATDRNKIKRLIREAYRKNKNIIYEHLQKTSGKIAIILIYSGKIIIPYSKIESKIILILQRLVKEHDESIK